MLSIKQTMLAKPCRRFDIYWGQLPASYLLRAISTFYWARAFSRSVRARTNPCCNATLSTCSVVGRASRSMIAARDPLFKALNADSFPSGLLSFIPQSILLRAALLFSTFATTNIFISHCCFAFVYFRSAHLQATALRNWLQSTVPAGSHACLF